MNSLILLIANAFSIFISILSAIKRDVIGILSFIKIKLASKEIEKGQYCLADFFRMNLKNHPNKVCFEFYDKKWTLEDVSKIIQIINNYKQ